MNIIQKTLFCSLTAFSALSLETSLQASQFQADLSQKSKPATIKVLLVKHADKILLEVKGRHHIYNPGDGVEISSAILAKRDFLTQQDRGIQWGDSYPGIFEIRVVPGDSQTTILVDGIQYKGCVEIYAIDGKINVVNEVDVENYLKSTLTTHFSQGIKQEAMDAIAILARTNAYYYIGRNAHSFWHVDAKEVGYLGYGATLQNVQVDKAVENTHHAILTYKNSPFAATWTPDSAGKTAEFSAIFRKEALAPSGVDAPLAASEREKHSWTFTLSKEQVAKLLGQDKVTGIDLYLEKNSGKVYGARIQNQESSETIDFFKLQKALGAKRLKSNDFTVALQKDTLVFKGYGEGHGVGLCLYSAKAMAEHGESAQKILSAFFPQTKLQNISSQAAFTVSGIEASSAATDKR